MEPVILSSNQFQNIFGSSLENVKLIMLFIFFSTRSMMSWFRRLLVFTCVTTITVFSFFTLMYQEKLWITLRKMFRSHQPHILFILADDYGWHDIGKERLLLNLVLNFKIIRTDGGLRPYVLTLMRCKRKVGNPSLKFHHWLPLIKYGCQQEPRY